MNRLFCFGLGYSAQRLARDLLKEGWEIAGTVRDPEHASSLNREGLEAVVFEGDSGTDEVDSLLVGATHVLDSIPPSRRQGLCPVGVFRRIHRQARGT